MWCTREGEDRKYENNLKDRIIEESLSSIATYCLCNGIRKILVKLYDMLDGKGLKD